LRAVLQDDGIMCSLAVMCVLEALLGRTTGTMPFRVVA
jgi:hypothetical protein